MIGYLTIVVKFYCSYVCVVPRCSFWVIDMIWVVGRIKEREPGRRERKGQEAGVLRGWEAGGNCKTLLVIY